jgi:hypothetical protein
LPFIFLIFGGTYLASLDSRHPVKAASATPTHDSGQDARSPRVTGKNSSTTIAFRATKSGDFSYFCSVPGHQLAGMQGQFVVMPKLPAQSLVEADISREPSDLPPPIGTRDPKTVLWTF